MKTAMETPSYDLIVIGAGPAGLTAATEAARAGLKVFCLDKLAPGGVLINLGELHDFEEIWSGPDMASRMTDDAAVAGVEIGFGEVTALSGNGPWTIETADGEKHTGARRRGRHRPGQGPPRRAEREAYEGRGVSHCAHCDAPLYAGLPVIVAGAGGWADYEAKELVGVASEVTMVDAAGRSRPAGRQAPAGPHCRPRRQQRAAVDHGGCRRGAEERSGERGVRLCRPAPAAEFLPGSAGSRPGGPHRGRCPGPHIDTDGLRGRRRPRRARYYLSEGIADGQRAAQSVVASLKKSQS
jgi:choline dehydrogenase-like flavoprotein